MQSYDEQLQLPISLKKREVIIKMKDNTANEVQQYKTKLQSLKDTIATKRKELLTDLHEYRDLLASQYASRYFALLTKKSVAEDDYEQKIKKLRNISKSKSQLVEQL